MPPPSPPPNTHRGCHGAWRWETACRPAAAQGSRLSATPTVSANADSLTSTRSTRRHTVFLAGVWGEASPQAPPEGAGGAKSEAQAEGAGGARSKAQAEGARRHYYIHRHDRDQHDDAEGITHAKREAAKRERQ